MDVYQPPSPRHFNFLFWFASIPTLLTYFAIIGGAVAVVRYLTQPENRAQLSGGFGGFIVYPYLTMAIIFVLCAVFITRQLLAANRRQPIKRTGLYIIEGFFYLATFPLMPAYVLVLFVAYVVENKGLGLSR